MAFQNYEDMRVGDVIECAGWVFQVSALDGRRIDKVTARPLNIVH